MTITDIFGREILFYPRGVIAITPNDGQDLPKLCQGIRVNVTGNVRVQYDDDSIATLKINAGSWEPGVFKKVFATGTDADLGIYGNPTIEVPTE